MPNVFTLQLTCVHHFYSFIVCRDLAQCTNFNITLCESAETNRACPVFKVCI